MLQGGGEAVLVVPAFVEGFEEGTWHPAPEIPRHVLEELFRTKIFAELLRHKHVSTELWWSESPCEESKIPTGLYVDAIKCIKCQVQNSGNRLKLYP